MKTYLGRFRPVYGPLQRFKKRIARSGAGKAGGFRAILFFRKDEQLFYTYVFAKSDRGNIEDDELRDFKKAARAYLKFTDKELTALIEAGKIKEIGL
ncbi:hypothetical protein FACS189493_7390 [Spirochaetia bacterium]|nr:hypothetical protein FACS189493_7390 [Spirochaetia bacterium]